MSTLDSLIPGTQPATDVVTRKVFIDAVEISNEIMLSTITVNKSFNKVAYAKLTFIDGSVSERDFELSNSDRFKPGKIIKVQLGYHGQVDTVFEGIIVKHGIKVRSTGASQLLIEAKDKAIKLTGSRMSAYHVEKTDSEVITALAGDLEKDIESTSFTHPQLVQFNASNWDFIVTRAEANGMLVFTDDGKLIVKKPSTLGASVCTLTYGDTIWEFEAETDSRKHARQITGRSWDYSQQQVEESNQSSVEFTDTGNFSNSEMGNVLESDVNLIHSGNLTTAQLNDWSKAYSMRTHLSHAVGRLRIKGRADITPGVLITLGGVGDRFNGKVYVTGVLHHYEGLWQTDVQFGWRDDWFHTKEDVMDRPAGGLVPGINGLQIGIVKSVEDDEGQYRVKVQAPLITSEANEGIWARVATLDAGAEHGVYFRPQIDDEVILGFLNDDPREPIVLGYLHSNDTKQSPLPEEDGALQYGIVTKEGNKLIFDDTNKSIKLRIPAGSGEKTLFMDASSGLFEMKDEHRNTIKMEASGITIEAGSGTVTIKGTQVLLN